MLFLFQDKQKSIKHLCFLVETKKLNEHTLKIKESLNQSMLVEDLLYYKDEETLDKDIKKLFSAMKKHANLVNDIQKQRNIGFNAGAIEDEVEYEEDEQ